MVYITDWTEFQHRSIRLYQHNPQKTRYLIKARPSTHLLTLKVTDDSTTLKFRTRSSVILGRFESFNKAIQAAMAGERDPLSLLQPDTATAPLPTTTGSAVTPPNATAVAGSTTASAAAAAAGTSVAPPGTTAGTGTGAGGKKKKKKGKK